MLLSHYSRLCTVLLLLVVGSKAACSNPCTTCAKNKSIYKTDRRCGPICVQAVLKHYGIELDMADAANLCNFDEQSGTSLEGICRALKARGLHARAVKLSADELLASGLPFIAHYYYGHYVAVTPVAASGFKITYGMPGDNQSAIFDRDNFPRASFAALFSGFAVLVSDDASKLPEQPHELGPDLRADTLVWDYGTVERSQVMSHIFKLRNHGGQTLRISAVKSECDCLAVSLSKSFLQPGEQADLVVTFDSSKSGPNQETISICSNDPAVPVMRLMVQGFVKPPILLTSPSFIDYGLIRHGSSAVRSLFVPQYPDESIRITKIDSDSKWLTATVRARTEDNPGYELLLVLVPEAPIGKLHGELVIHTTHYAQKTIRIIVTADVYGNIDLDSDSFFLGLVKKGDEKKCAVTISTVHKDPLKIEKIDNPLPHLSVDIKPKVEGKEYILTAALKPDAPAGNIKGEVVIHTNDPDQPVLKLPVYAYVEEGS